MMKSVIVKLAVVGFILLQACNSNSQQIKTSLSATEFSEKIKGDSNAQILDVRTAGEYARGYIAGSKNVDWNGSDFDKNIESIIKDKPVYVYCLSGMRSAEAAQHMRESGYKTVFEMDGGLLQWRKAGLPEITQAAPKKLTMTKAQLDSIIQKNNIVFVDFYADWCGPCKKMKPVLEEIATEKKDSLLLLRIDADLNPLLMRQMYIDELPTLLIYKNHQRKSTVIGIATKEELLKNIAQ
ncbi:MAG: thioredoxin [Bacteroidetes bacterium]|nr:thioredoxin [Bacteroidota bacterium]